jgi:hypothetical protein
MYRMDAYVPPAHPLALGRSPPPGRGRSNLFRKLFALLAFPITIAVLWALPRNAHAQLYITPGNGTVSEYDATTGAAINANFITGLQFPPIGIAVK